MQMVISHFTVWEVEFLRINDPCILKQVSVIPYSASVHLDSETETAALDWISSALLMGQ